jgi:hypothetical protein
MVDNYIIETHFGAAGLVVRSGRDFCSFQPRRSSMLSKVSYFQVPNAPQGCHPTKSERERRV